jgi:hypothetical protein
VGTKDGVAGFVSSKDGRGCFAFHRFGVYEVGVIQVDDEELGIALAGQKNEAAGLIRKDLACRVHDCSEAMMGVKARGGSGRKGVVVGFKVGNGKQGGSRQAVGWSLGWFGSGLWFGGAEVMAGLVKMAFGCGDRVGWKFGEEGLGALCHWCGGVK